ncbi:hypothetical protein FRX31_028592 [Thalictrum thalictroides]|uniref:FBD domain-containing protein n=1 Tax=Thalictrum thalictroides TaxID=46969 RepID=A0A7J6VC66_THATH|nr:hypothetical protein FRX31_028592 [Thalictrum thalictroides]
MFPKLEVTIFAPMLVSLKIKGYISDKYLAVGLSSLVKADIDMVNKHDEESDTNSDSDRDTDSEADRDTDSEADSDTESEFDSGAYYSGIKSDSEIAAVKEIGINVMLLLASVCNAKSLTVSTSLLEVIGKNNGHLPIPFSALRQLRLKTMLSRESIQGIKYILRNSCILEKLLVEIVRTKASTQIKIWEYWGADLLTDLEGIFYDLRFAEFRNVRGCLIELEILKGLLKNATGLEKLIIFISKGQPYECRRQLMKKIIESPKASSSAAVSFF